MYACSGNTRIVCVWGGVDAWAFHGLCPSVCEYFLLHACICLSMQSHVHLS